LSESARITLFLFYYAVVYALSFASRYTGEGLKDDIIKSFEEWVTCSVTTMKDCGPTTRFPYVLGLVTLIFYGINGIVVFLCFGLSREVHNWWRKVLTNPSRKLFTKAYISQTSKRSSSGTGKNSIGSVPMRRGTEEISI
jgi:hypothetical protein